jgi:creatinine amidohydrolase
LAIMTTRRFTDLSGPEAARRLTADSVLIQPVGAVEHHGPHLPLSCDLLVADALAAAAVATWGEELDLWLLPPLAYTKSNEHAWAPGTVWLSAPTLLAVLGDMARSLATTPARRLVFLNGHGGNSALLQVACRDIRLDTGMRTFLMHPGVPADQGGASPPGELGMGVHGGTDETSVVMHLRPDLVDLSLAVRSVPEHMAANRYVRFGGPVSFGWLSDDFGTGGVVGDPTAATAERGKELWDGMVAAAGEALAEIATFDPLG